LNLLNRVEVSFITISFNMLINLLKNRKSNRYGFFLQKDFVVVDSQALQGWQAVDDDPSRCA
jgi:hypothetical protein